MIFVQEFKRYIFFRIGRRMSGLMFFCKCLNRQLLSKKNILQLVKMEEGETLRTAGSWPLLSELAYSHCSYTVWDNRDQYVTLNCHPIPLQ
jgi:hypothetical protein